MRRPYNIGCGSNTWERESSLPSFSVGRLFDSLTAPQAQEVGAEQRDAGAAGGKDPELVEGSQGRGAKAAVVSGCVSMFRQAQHNASSTNFGWEEGS